VHKNSPKMATKKTLTFFTPDNYQNSGQWPNGNRSPN
jgi:hypothetical protein